MWLGLLFWAIHMPFNRGLEKNGEGFAILSWLLQTKRGKVIVRLCW
jgi:hypothetical protein